MGARKLMRTRACELRQHCSLLQTTMTRAYICLCVCLLGKVSASVVGEVFRYVFPEKLTLFTPVTCSKGWTVFFKSNGLGTDLVIVAPLVPIMERAQGGRPSFLSRLQLVRCLLTVVCIGSLNCCSQARQNPHEPTSLNVASGAGVLLICAKVVLLGACGAATSVTPSAGMSNMHPQGP